jgi:hypothetical protein
MLLLEWIGSRAECGGNKYRQILTKFGKIPAFAMPAGRRMTNARLFLRHYWAPPDRLKTEFAVAA